MRQVDALFPLIQRQVKRSVVYHKLQRSKRSNVLEISSKTQSTFTGTESSGNEKQYFINPGSPKRRKFRVCLIEGTRNSTLPAWYHTLISHQIITHIAIIHRLNGSVHYTCVRINLPRISEYESTNICTVISKYIHVYNCHYIQETKCHTEMKCHF